MKVFTAEEMRAVDHRAIEELGIPGPVLMENAALGAVDALAARFPAAESVVVLAGPGNNGGDGLAMARQLDGRGYACRTFLVLRASEPKGDAALQLEILERAGMTVTRVGPEDSLDPVLAACRETDLVVDALFGTGLERPLEGHFASLVAGVAAAGTPLLAVDLPSGLDASRARPIGPHLAAELTVTFARPKIAHVLPPACDAVGELAIADLGLPRRLLEEADATTHLLLGSELAPLLAPRARDAHKGRYGHVLIVAGAPGTAGAAILAARAAVRGGAGLVTCAVPEPIRDVVDGGSIESMTLALDAGGDGRLAGGAVATVVEAAGGKSAVALGPGLGTEPMTVAAVREIVRRLDLPLVLDADGLNAFAGALDSLRDHSAATVLTPHPGELGRLLGRDAAAVQADRPAAAREAAARSGAVVVLKGRRTLVAEPGGVLHVNPTGNAGMATGGSGDVLTGLVAALIGQVESVVDAVRLGVYLHGLAGDLAAEETGEIALVAGDLITALPRAFGRLGER